MKLLRSKKGFTLVEIIVVLVIIAILAAISLPALTGYIDEANQKAVISEARTVWVAMQTISSTMFGEGKADGDVIKLLEDKDAGKKAIADLTGMDKAKIKDIEKTDVQSGTIVDFIYKSTPPVHYYDGALHSEAKKQP